MGLRGYYPDEKSFEWMREQGFRYHTMAEIEHRGFDAVMDDVIAGKAVHTEWCYPRNGRTYDLIDTRVENADGSVSKLKMFRDMTERVDAQKALEQRILICV